MEAEEPAVGVERRRPSVPGLFQGKVIKPPRRVDSTNEFLLQMVWTLGAMGPGAVEHHLAEPAAPRYAERVKGTGGRKGQTSAGTEPTPPP